MTDKKTTKRTADEMEHQDGRSDTVKAQVSDRSRFSLRHQRI